MNTQSQPLFALTATHGYTWDREHFIADPKKKYPKDQIHVPCVIKHQLVPDWKIAKTETNHFDLIRTFLAIRARSIPNEFKGEIILVPKK